MISQKNKNRLFFFLVLISSLGHMSTDIYLPSLPAIAEAFRIDISTTQWLIVTYMLGFSLAPLCYGPISDHKGRCKPLISGLVLGLLSSIICFSSNNIKIFIIARFFQGLGMGATVALFRSILRDLFSSVELSKYSAYSTLITFMILAISPIIGGYLQHYYGWRSSFITLSLLTCLALLTVLFAIPETYQELKPERLSINKMKLNLLMLVTNKVFVGFCCINFLAYGAMIAWLTTAPILFEHVLGLSPINFGWIYALPSIGVLFGAIFNSHFVKQYGTLKLLQLGIFLMMAAGLCLISFKWFGYINVTVIIGPAILLLFSLPLIFNNAFAEAFHPFPHISGMAAALFGTLTTLGGFFSSSILTIWQDLDQFPLALVVLSYSVLAQGIYMWIISKS